MSDATNRGGALAAVYRKIKTRDNGFMRMDKQKVIDEAMKLATLKGDGRNKPMAKVLGPEKDSGKVKY